jgi:effector-binding domain-containing protein
MKIILITFLAIFLIYSVSFPKENKKISIIELPEQTLIAIMDSSANVSEIQQKMEKAYTEIFSFALANGSEMIGAPIAITINYTETSWSFIAGVPISIAKGVTEGRVFFHKIPAGRVVKYVYIGPYEKMAPAYDEIKKYIQENKLEMNGNAWESYISDPADTETDKLETDIFFPVK